MRYDDPAFEIDWPLPASVISEKDRSWPTSWTLPPEAAGTALDAPDGYLTSPALGPHARRARRRRRAGSSANSSNARLSSSRIGCCARSTEASHPTAARARAITV